MSVTLIGALTRKENSFMISPSNKPVILAVDDAAFVCDTLRTWLQDTYDIHTFLDGKSALEFLGKNETDLILLDYDMPGMTGYEVLMKIRQNPTIKRRIPIVFLTAVTNERMEEEMLNRGADAYIRKPLDIGILKHTINEYLTK